MSLDGKQLVQEEWDLRTRLSAVRDTLRPAEQRVADFLLQEGAEYPDFALAQLAEAAGTSQSAVVDMCKTMGLSGFREFRLMWVKEQATRSALALPESPLFGGLISGLLHTEQLLRNGIDRAVARLLRAKEIFLFASGGSGLVAELCAEGLAVAGRLVFTFKSNEAIGSAHFDEQTVLVVISHRGANPILAQAMQQARAVGATTILITGRPQSELAALADELLVTSCPYGQSMRLITSEVRAIQMAVVHALVSAFRRHSKQREVDLQTYQRWHERQGLE